MSDIDVRVSDYEMLVKPLADQTPIPEEIETNDDVYSDPMPGEDDPIAVVPKTKILAQRVTQVSDVILFNSLVLAASQTPLILVPKHRDRLRVTVQAIVEEGAPFVYLGAGPDVSETNGFQIATSDPFILSTRDAIWCATGTGSGTVRVQYVTELITESCGCGAGHIHGSR